MIAVAVKFGFSSSEMVTPIKSAIDVAMLIIRPLRANTKRISKTSRVSSSVFLLSCIGAYIQAGVEKIRANPINRAQWAALGQAGTESANKRSSNASGHA
jgi:hypothetical protein